MAKYCFKCADLLTPQATAPLPCPRGTYSNLEGLIQVSQCVTCPPGKYCPDTNTTDVSGACAEPYILVAFQGRSSSPFRIRDLLLN